MVVSRLVEDPLTWPFGRVRGLRPARGHWVADAALAGHGATPLAHCRRTRSCRDDGLMRGAAERVDCAGPRRRRGRPDGVGDLVSFVCLWVATALGLCAYPGPAWTSRSTSFGAAQAGGVPRLCGHPRATPSRCGTATCRHHRGRSSSVAGPPGRRRASGDRSRPRRAPRHGPVVAASHHRSSRVATPPSDRVGIPVRPRTTADYLDRLSTR